MVQPFKIVHFTSSITVIHSACSVVQLYTNTLCRNWIKTHSKNNYRDRKNFFSKILKIFAPRRILFARVQGLVKMFLNSKIWLSKIARQNRRRKFFNRFSTVKISIFPPVDSLDSGEWYPLGSKKFQNFRKNKLLRSHIFNAWVYWSAKREVLGSSGC